MRKNNFVNSLVIFFLLLFLFFSPQSVVKSKSLQQNSSQIQATGQFCDNVLGFCGDMTITFNPAGGPVNGSISGTYSTEQYGILHVNGTLEGTYAYTDIDTDTGEKGGVVIGKISSGIWDWKCQKDYCFVATPTSLAGMGWQGFLYANGTGNGEFGFDNSTWKVTFSSTDFQAGLPNPTSEPMRNMPTLASLPENPLEIEGEVINNNPTETETIIQQGDPVAPIPGEKIRWVWGQVPVEYYRSWYSIDQVIAEGLGQDGALIARDNQGNFYVIDNQGNRKPVPSDLAETLMFTNGLALLNNRELLIKNPTIAAMVAKEGESVMDEIDGKGQFQYYEPPDWVQGLQYLYLMRNCNQGVCENYMRIGTYYTSTYIDTQALFSSEHSSVRGTINGGGDFIYEPKPLFLASFILSAIQPVQSSKLPAYLGVLVKDTTDGAEITQIQSGSPAENAGLQIGDIVQKIADQSLDSTHKIDAVLAQCSGGQDVEISFQRNGKIESQNITLAKLMPLTIETPSIKIVTTNKSKFVYDIGMDGISGIVVLADTVHVIELQTNTEVEVPAGMALIVVPGEPVGEPFSVTDNDINSWWNNPSSTGSNNSVTQTNSSVNKDFNPIPGLDGETIYWGGWIILTILFSIIMIIKLIKK